MSAPDDSMTDDQAADALLDAIAEMRRDPCEELADRLRALITEWRRRVDDRQRVAAESDDPDAHDGFITGTTVCADELERAIGDGDA